ncbi:MAG: hypothetical protein M1344_02600 [Candidatus Thermoplasmatota archaeon]|nr:hypothetical protein [Candidatus Thermoplasmatota archaeon]
MDSDPNRLNKDSISFIQNLNPGNNYAEARIYIKTLYELYQRTILEALSKALPSSLGSIQSKDLKKRFEELTFLMNIARIEKAPIEKWRPRIICLHEERNKIEHNDLYVPGLSKFTPLEKMLKELDDFREYLSGFCVEYDSKFLTLDLNSKIQLVGEALFNDLAIKLERTTLEKNSDAAIAKRVFTTDYILMELEQIDDLIKIIMWPIFQNYEKLSGLIMLVGAIYYLESRETAYISMEICPKCGGKIEDTAKYGGIGEDGPSYVHQRVGCNSCEYTLNDETISI